MTALPNNNLADASASFIANTVSNNVVNAHANIVNLSTNLTAAHAEQVGKNNNVSL